MAQIARAAMTRTVCRMIAVWSRTWDWASQKQPLPNSKPSAGQRRPTARTSRDRDNFCPRGHVAVVKGQLTGGDVAADQQGDGEVTWWRATPTRTSDRPWRPCRRANIYSKRLDYQSGRPDLNRRPLDPQSRSVRRWAWLSVAWWAPDQPR